MNNTNVKVGTGIVAKVGCNEVKAVITEIGENGIMARSHKSGKEFRVKTILQVESAPEVIRETPKPEKKLSLFSAAIKVMETGPAGQTYSVKELVAETIAQGLWTPGAGKTPDMTLYAAILRDIATKEHPRIVRAEVRGNQGWQRDRNGAGSIGPNGKDSPRSSGNAE